jgi:hypothetical protein
MGPRDPTLKKMGSHNIEESTKELAITPKIKATYEIKWRH